MNERLLNAIRKKAYGYDYVEVATEEEIVGVSRFVRCVRDGRIYCKVGFIGCGKKKIKAIKQKVKKIKFVLPLVALSLKNFKKLTFQKKVVTII